MLRVILATCGVGLIAFGLFGGKSLEQVHAGLSGVFDRYKGTDNIEAVVDAADSTSEQLASAVDDATDNTEAGTQTVAMATPSAVADQADETDETVTAANVVTDSTGTDVDTDDAPLATTQTAVLAASEERQLEVASVQAVNAVAGNDSGVVENAALTEVKASARNEELERALSTTGAEGKDADVGVVMQATNGNSDVEALFVLKDLVNMRQGPSIDHAIVLRLEKGQELMEFKREGKWVHVGAYGTSGKIGWVHQRLVGKTPG